MIYRFDLSECLSSEGRLLIPCMWHVSAKSLTSQLDHRDQRWRKVEFIARTCLPDIPWPWPSVTSLGLGGKRRWVCCPGCLSAQPVVGMLRGVCLKNGGGERIIRKGSPPSSASTPSKETLECWAPRSRHLWSWKRKGPSTWIFFIQTLKGKTLSNI